jgi:outer membrane protein OmpA-like peptidoglycan-associated protein/tetratricopeptide (TPR) repeat protein
MDYRTIFTDAEYYFLFNDFPEALPLYQKLLNEKTENANLNYRIGRCYLSIPGMKHKAIPYLEKAILETSSTYQEGSYKEEKAPINSYFFLGEAYRIEGKLLEAIETYNTFRSLLDTKDVYSLDYVDQQIKACQRAMSMMQNPINIELVNIPLFETNKYILGPVVSGDGTTMAFTSQEKFYDAIYISKKKEGGEWGSPINITLDLKVEGEIYTTSLNFDGTQLFLYKDDRGTGNIYSSIQIDGKWQHAQKLGKKVATRYWETYASVSPDGQTLYFSSNRKGSQGGLDIYCCKKQPNGEWGEPTNLGSTINTPYNEEAPYLSADGNTLFFISQGHNSIGGYDIFYSQKIGENEWSKPINMGYPINTTDDDMSFFPIGESKGLITKVDKGTPNVRKVYSVNILPEEKKKRIELIGNISLSNSFEVQENQFKVTLLELESQKLIEVTFPEAITGLFKLEVSPGAYRLIARGEGYTQQSIPIVIPDTYAQDKYNVDIKLTPESVTSGEFLLIRSILFDFDCADLSREATFEIEKVFGIMNKYPNLTIEVCGHTDIKGSAQYNYKLSLRRAQSVIDYLVKKGINSDRMVARGASTFENVATNINPDGTDNPEGRSLNRRASISVIDSNEDVTIQAELNIPEHLKPREQHYTILLAPINNSINPDAESKINVQSGLSVRKLTGSDGKFANVIGSFEHKSRAIDLLNYSIDNGFPKATIIGVQDLGALISLPAEEPKEIVEQNENVYTIQILARQQQVQDQSIFKGLEVKEIKSNDGIFRYIYGRFNGMGSALEELEQVKQAGFPDAFIMNINRYK